MITTRRITGVVRRMTGALWTKAEVTFALQKDNYTAEAQFPTDKVKVLTDAQGAFDVGLWCNSEGLSSDVKRTKYRYYENGEHIFSFFLIPGPAAIDISALRAANQVQPAPANAVLLQAVVDAHGAVIASADGLGHIRGGGFGYEIEEDGTLQITVHDLDYTHAQSQAAAVWVIEHNLGKFPSLTIVDSGGSEVEGAVVHDSLNQATVTFSATFGGTAYCN